MQRGHSDASLRCEGGTCVEAPWLHLLKSAVGGLRWHAKERLGMGFGRWCGQKLCQRPLWHRFSRICRLKPVPQSLLAWVCRLSKRKNRAGERSGTGPLWRSALLAMPLPAVGALKPSKLRWHSASSGLYRRRHLRRGRPYRQIRTSPSNCRRRCKPEDSRERSPTEAPKPPEQASLSSRSRRRPPRRRGPPRCLPRRRRWRRPGTRGRWRA